jgi:HSP20 family protein
MSSSRWDPWGDIVSLREAMNNLLEESFVRPRSAGSGTPGTLGLAVDLFETPEEFVLTASVPGVNPSEVTISVLGETVRISGFRPDLGEGQRNPEGSRWLIRERHFGAFDRTVSLPAPLRADEASADFENGVLTVTLPKAEQAKPRTITVRSGGGAGSREIDVRTGTGGESAV